MVCYQFQIIFGISVSKQFNSLVSVYKPVKFYVPLECRTSNLIEALSLRLKILVSNQDMNNLKYPMSMLMIS